MSTSRITYRAFFKPEAFEGDGGALPAGVTKDSSQHPIIMLSKDVDPEVYPRIPRVGERVWIKLRGNAHQDLNWRVKDVMHCVDSPDGVSILLEGQDSFGAIGITEITYLTTGQDGTQLKKTVKSAAIPRAGESVWIDLSGDSVRDMNWEAANVTHNVQRGNQSVLVTLADGRKNHLTSDLKAQKKRALENLLSAVCNLVLLCVGIGLIGRHIGMADWESTLVALLLWSAARSEHVFQRAHLNSWK